MSKAAEFLGCCAGGRQLFHLTWPTLTSYLCMATHPVVFGRPLSHACAVRNVEALLAVSSCRVIIEEEGFWDVYRESTRDMPTRGNLVPDACLAALLNQHGVVTIYTHDRDFREILFPGRAGSRDMRIGTGILPAAFLSATLLRHTISGSPKARTDPPHR